MEIETSGVLDIDGREYKMLAGKMYMVGCVSELEDKVDIQLRCNEGGVDARHALFIVYRDKIKLIDLYSKTGTYWNDRRIKGLREIILDTSGTVKFGKAPTGTLKLTLFQPTTIFDYVKSPNNCSKIFRSSPKSASQPTRPVMQSRYNLTSTPCLTCHKPKAHEMVKETGFLESFVPVRKSYNSNTRKPQSFNIPSTQVVSLNGSLGNKTVDSFCIPETQQCLSHVGISVNSMGGKTCCNKSLDSLLNIQDDDNDFSIPETQEGVSTYSKSQTRKCCREERAILDANLPDDIFAEDNENVIAGSQFRICTQDFNEARYSPGDDSNDLLLGVPHLLMISDVQQKPVLLGETKRPKPMATKVKESQQGVTTCKKDGLVVDKEMLAIQFDQATKCPEVDDARDLMCTPDLLDMPELAQLNAKDAFHNSSFTRSSMDTHSAGLTTEVKEADTPDPAIVEDDFDFMPTQIFTTKAGGDRKGADGRGSPEGLTLSDKENLKPTAAAMLVPVGDIQPTQAFGTSEANNSLPRTVEITTTRTVVETSSNVSTGEADDFTPTQIFTTRKVKQSTYESFISKSHDSVAVPSDIELINDAEPIVMEQHTPQNTTDINLCRPIDSLSTEATSNVTTAQSPDVDLLLCTPQLISDNFKQHMDKNTLINKNKMLFGDDSDSDVLELITAPKVSRDFDKLLPHLKKQQLSPKPKDVNAKMPLYNQSFTESGETKKNKLGDGDQKVESRNRDQRHEARDWKRDKVANTSIKNDQNMNKKIDTTKSNNKIVDDIAAEAVSKNHNKVTGTISKTGAISKNNKKGDDKLVGTVLRTDKRIGDKMVDSVSRHDPKNHYKVDETVSKTDQRKPNKVDKIETRNDTRKHDKVAEIVSKNNKREGYKVVETVSKNTKINKTRKDTKDSIKNVEHSSQIRKRKNESENGTDSKSPKNDKFEKGEVGKRRNERIRNKAEHDETSDKITQEGSNRRSTRSKSHVPSTSSKTDPFNVLPSRRITRLQSHMKELEALAMAKTPQKTSDEQFQNGPKEPSKCTTNNQEEYNKQHNLKRPIVPYLNIIESNGTSYDSSFNQNTSTETAQGRSFRSLNSYNELMGCPSKLASMSSAPNLKTNLSHSIRKLKISVTMVNPERFEYLSRTSTGIWVVAADPTESDILIMDKSNRTYKFLLAMARGIPIVTSRWLECVNREREIVSITEHFYADEAFESRYRFSIIKGIESARKHKILAGYDFLMTDNIKPIPSELKQIILCAGGSVHVVIPSHRDHQKLYLVTSKIDQKLWHKYRRLNNKIRIISTEGIMSTVMRQIIRPLRSSALT